jgi:hypothetical protein
MDARAYLTQSTDKYDMIVVDLFRDPVSVPENLTTLEFREEVITRRTQFLLDKVRDVEQDKLAEIERQREQCLTVLESMRSARRQVMKFVLNAPGRAAMLSFEKEAMLHSAGQNAVFSGARCDISRNTAERGCG